MLYGGFLVGRGEASLFWIVVAGRGRQRRSARGSPTGWATPRGASGCCAGGGCTSRPSGSTRPTAGSTATATGRCCSRAACRSSARSSRCRRASPACPSGASPILTLIGCIPWVLMLAFAGRAVGDNWESLQKQLHYVDYVLAAAIIGSIVYLVVRHRRRRRAALAPLDAPNSEGGHDGHRGDEGASRVERVEVLFNRGELDRIEEFVTAGLRQPRGLARRGPRLRGLPPAPGPSAQRDPGHPPGGPRGRRGRRPRRLSGHALGHPRGRAARHGRPRGAGSRCSTCTCCGCATGCPPSTGPPGTTSGMLQQLGIIPPTGGALGGRGPAPTTGAAGPGPRPRSPASRRGAPASSRALMSS